MSGEWERARVAAIDANVEIRRLRTLPAADEAMAVMRATWGDNQTVPRELLRAFEASENLLQGAYRNGLLVGFALGFYGRDEDGFNLHSHMLAVLPDLRTAGVGYSLKLAQRAATLEAGVSRIRWTFDPLVSRNAFFNLTKLGAVADGFERDFYGDMDDTLNTGDRSDRLMVRWDAPGDTEQAATPVPDETRAFQVLGLAGDVAVPKPSSVRMPPESGPAVVRIPADYPALRERDPALGASWREAFAEAAECCFASGRTAFHFTRESVYVFR
jgi:predicted GNAT superfamily acetyltransferase